MTLPELQAAFAAAGWRLWSLQKNRILWVLQGYVAKASKDGRVVADIPRLHPHDAYACLIVRLELDKEITYDQAKSMRAALGPAPW